MPGRKEAATGIGAYLALSTAIYTLGPLTELSVALQELGQLSKLFWLNLMRSYMYQIGLRKPGSKCVYKFSRLYLKVTA